MNINLENPRIYVACLASYNNGILHGCWIDAVTDVDTMRNEIQIMLSKSPIANAEDYAIHDYEGFGSFIIEQYTDLETICDYVAFYEEYEELGLEVSAYYGDIESAKEALENHYHGEYDSELDYATELFDECYAHELSEPVKSYIDYDAFCRDLFINDYLSIELNGKVYVFSHH